MVDLARACGEGIPADALTDRQAASLAIERLKVGPPPCSSFSHIGQGAGGEATADAGLTPMGAPQVLADEIEGAAGTLRGGVSESKLPRGKMESSRGHSGGAASPLIDQFSGGESGGTPLDNSSAPGKLPF